MVSVVTLDEIWSAVALEQTRARRLHSNLHVGHVRAPNHWRHLILSEEVGEVATAIQDDDLDQLRAELIQVAATAVAWLGRL